MTPLERRMLVLSLTFALLSATVLTGRAALGAARFSPDASAVSGSYYGANETWVSSATEDWPQKGSNWCGVATVAVVANYTYQLYGGQNYFPFHVGGQQQIVNDMNSDAAVSQWGTPTWNGVGPGFRADISRDFGTDPRSLAWAALYESTAGAQLHLQRAGYTLPRWATDSFSMHNVIYHGSVVNAVAGMARTLARFQQPLSVTTDHGLHSIVVSGVYATTNPISQYPANVTAVVSWDPGVGSPWGGNQSAREVTWANYTFNNTATMWGSVYSANGNDDPDPAVGIYTPNGSYPSHWIGFRTTIEPDSQTSVSVDYALDENGTVMQHP
jgi:hypothetical protein